MGRTACTEPQWLYKGARCLFFYFKTAQKGVEFKYGVKGKNRKSTRNIFIPDNGGSIFLRHDSIKSKKATVLTIRPSQFESE